MESSILQAEKNRPMAQSLITRLLLLGGAVGPLLFVVVLLIEGATRPGYSAWHNYGSDLSLGDQGWMQIANFIVCGVLTLGFAIGLRQVFHTGRGSVWGPIMLGLFAVAMIVAGVFVTDPNMGYPPGTVGNPPPTLHGIIHGFAGLAVFVFSLPAATFILTRRFAGDPAWKGWALYSFLVGLLLIGIFIAFTVVANLEQNGIWPNSPVGLLQRIGIIAGWSWISFLAIRLLRQTSTSAPIQR
jgi:hypothetical protein